LVFACPKPLPSPVSLVFRGRISGDPLPPFLLPGRFCLATLLCMTEIMLGDGYPEERKWRDFSHEYQTLSFFGAFLFTRLSVPDQRLLGFNFFLCPVDPIASPNHSWFRVACWILPKIGFSGHYVARGRPFTGVLLDESFPNQAPFSLKTPPTACGPIRKVLLAPSPHL